MFIDGFTSVKEKLRSTQSRENGILISLNCLLNKKKTSATKLKYVCNLFHAHM